MANTSDTRHMWWDFGAPLVAALAPPLVAAATGSPEAMQAERLRVNSINGSGPVSNYAARSAPNSLWDQLLGRGADTGGGGGIPWLPLGLFALLGLGLWFLLRKR